MLLLFFFDLDDGSSMFLGNIGRLPPDNATVTCQKMLIFTVIGLIEKRYLKHFRECISP